MKKENFTRIALALTLTWSLTACNKAGNAISDNSAALGSHSKAASVDDPSDDASSTPGMSEGGSPGTGEIVTAIDLSGVYQYSANGLSFTLEFSGAFPDAKPMDRGAGIATPLAQSQQAAVSADDEVISNPQPNNEAVTIPRNVVINADCKVAGKSEESDTKNPTTTLTQGQIKIGSFLMPAMSCPQALAAANLVAKSVSYSLTDKSLQLRLSDNSVLSFQRVK